VPDAGSRKDGARPSASDETAAPAPTELVTRPEPGLGRGKWEGSGLSIGLLGGTAIVLFGSFLGWKVWKQRRARNKK
jgi:hypothetical protein